MPESDERVSSRTGNEDDTTRREESAGYPDTTRGIQPYNAETTGIQPYNPEAADIQPDNMERMRSGNPGYLGARSNVRAVWASVNLGLIQSACS